MIIGFILLIIVLGIVGLVIAIRTIPSKNASFKEKRRCYEIEKFLDDYAIGICIIAAVGILIIKFL